MMDESAMEPNRSTWSFEGRFVYAAAAGMLGLIWLASGDFINVWQPVADGFPARSAVVYLSAGAFLASAVGLLFRRAAPVAAIVPTAVYLLFVWGWITRIILKPDVFGVWSGCAEELVLVIAGVLLITAGRPGRSGTVVPVARVVFGLCAVSFGVIHFDALEETAKLVPEWIPGSGTFWAMATGLAHAAGGIALVVSFRGRIAARLLAAMYFVFELSIWLPMVWATPRDPIAWGGNAITIAIAASALVLADALKRPPLASAVSDEE
jgi:uncharacterized membrane protein